ncbi:MAG: MFS transporter [Pseudoclavibacter sp.]
MAALVALAASTFISVTIEMLPTGLMHLMAPELGVSNAAIGLLMTVFAFTVVLSSTPITHLTRRLPRHTLLVVVLAIFATGAIGTAIAPTYGLVVATRILTGLAHGVFWAVVASYTSLIVTSQQLTKAISITLGGGSAAYVLGVPIGTFLGDAFGWRMAFGGLAVLALVVAGVLWMLLPRVDHLALMNARTAAQPVVRTPAGADADPATVDPSDAARTTADAPGAARDATASDRATDTGALKLELQPAPTGPIAIQAEYGTAALELDPDPEAESELAPEGAPEATTDSESNAADPKIADPDTADPTAVDSAESNASTASGNRPQQSLSRVIMLCALTFAIMLAQYAAYSYISPFVIDVIGIEAGVLALVLFGYGVASAVGTLLTGMMFQERRTLGFVITFGIMFSAVGILAFAPPAWLAIAALVLWGVGMGFMPPLLQTTLLLVAPKRIRDVSSALYTSGFNLGIGSGALVGGWILEGLGIGVIMPFFLVVIAIAFVAWASFMLRQRAAAGR